MDKINNFEKQNLIEGVSFGTTKEQTNQQPMNNGNNVTNLNVARGVVMEQKTRTYHISNEEKRRLNEIKNGSPLTEEDMLNSRVVRQSVLNTLDTMEIKPLPKEEIEYKLEMFNKLIDMKNTYLNLLEKSIKLRKSYIKENQLILKIYTSDIEFILKEISDIEDGLKNTTATKTTIKDDLLEILRLGNEKIDSLNYKSNIIKEDIKSSYIKIEGDEKEISDTKSEMNVIATIINNLEDDLKKLESK